MAKVPVNNMENTKYYKNLVRTKNEKEAAILCLFFFLSEEVYLSKSLDIWIEQANPSQQQIRQATQICLGSCRMLRYLEKAINTCVDRKLKVPLFVKAAMICGVYQKLFLSGIRDHAAVHSNIEIIKKYSPKFVGFANAILRKVLPLEKVSIAEKYSYPDILIDKLSHLDAQKRIHILNAMNQRAKTFIRKRPSLSYEEVTSKEIKSFAQDKNIYIQNPTTIGLIKYLSKGGDFQNCLDVCSAPGGKAIAIKDLYPNIALTLCDISKERMKRLKQNLAKAEVQADILCVDASTYAFPEKYDLIVIDAPCTNSGVLHKKPEARWRLSQDYIQECVTLQKSLLSHVVNFLQPQGEIWYLTCSILDEENIQLAKDIQHLLPLKIKRSAKQIYPDEKGFDGGFAVSFSLSKADS